MSSNGTLEQSFEEAYRWEIEQSRRRTRTGMTKGGVVCTHEGEETKAKQGIPIYVGVSERNSGSYGLSMQRVVIPPGGHCRPHSHVGSETALYILSGHAVTYHGRGLTQRTESGPGDFVYIAPGVPHCAYNLSDTEPVIAITARTDANDQERVAPYEFDDHVRRSAA
jgi:uncharacterized RmlC-like cupin family protein